MPTRHIALVPESGINPSDLARVSAALQKQILRDLAPIWEVSATVDSFPSLEDVPAGYWPVILTFRALGVESGIHVDRNGQPYALIEMSPSWSLTASHVAIEMITDPFGSRAFPGASPRADQGDVEFRGGVCDPCEHPESAYLINDVLVSDFCTPAYWEPTSKERRSFTGAVQEAYQVLSGGHLCWYDPTTNTWWLRRVTDGQVSDVEVGLADPERGQVREFICRHAMHLQSTKMTLDAFEARVGTTRQRALRASQSRAYWLRSLLEGGRERRPLEIELEAEIRAELGAARAARRGRPDDSLIPATRRHTVTSEPALAPPPPNPFAPASSPSMPQPPSDPADVVDDEEPERAQAADDAANLSEAVVREIAIRETSTPLEAERSRRSNEPAVRASDRVTSSGERASTPGESIPDHGRTLPPPIPMPSALTPPMPLAVAVASSVMPPYAAAPSSMPTRAPEGSTPIAAGYVAAPPAAPSAAPALAPAHTAPPREETVRHTLPHGSVSVSNVPASTRPATVRPSTMSVAPVERGSRATRWIILGLAATFALSFALASLVVLRRDDASDGTRAGSSPPAAAGAGEGPRPLAATTATPVVTAPVAQAVASSPAAVVVSAKVDPPIPARSKAAAPAPNPVKVHEEPTPVPYRPAAVPAERVAASGTTGKSANGAPPPATEGNTRTPAAAAPRGPDVDEFGGRQ